MQRGDVVAVPGSVADDAVCERIVASWDEPAKVIATSAAAGKATAPSGPNSRRSPGASSSCTATCGVAIGPERQKPPAINGRTAGAGAKESSTFFSKSRS